MTNSDLRRAADALALDYLHGRWQPAGTEEHRARILSAGAVADAGMDGLATGGVITAAAIAQLLRPAPNVDSWRLAPVLRAYLRGEPEAQALVRDLIHGIGAGLRPGRYTEAPALEETTATPTVFVAGGISHLPNWQIRAVLQLLTLSRAHVLNPRREAYTVGDQAAAVQQIGWEYAALHRADVIMWWFPAGAVQPIALYELGAHAARDIPIVVGADPAYERRLDVVEQLRHVRPELTVHTTLDATVLAATALLPVVAPS